MSTDRPTKIATDVIHAGQHNEPITGAVMPPIFTSSTYAQESPGVHKGFEYTRSHNPTRYAMERMVAKLESSGIDESDDPSCGGFAFASGLAAIGTVLELIDSGATVIAMDDLYGGTNRLFSKVRERTQGLKFDYVDLADLSAFEAAMSADVAMVWIETPTNPTLKLADLAELSRIAKAKNPNVIVACDNTFATPINQRPLELGCDIVMHSITKYMNGHSDVVGGVLVTNRKDISDQLRFLQNAVGSVMSPFDAYLTLRGIKTLDVRMCRHNESASRIAAHLESHPAVERVVFPGLESHPQHELYRKQMSGPSGMITFFIRGGLDEARLFLENVRIFALAESLGGVESLVEHPAIMTHASVPADQREQLGISDTLIRLSIGVEDCGDLIADIDGALQASGAAKLAPANA